LRSIRVAQSYLRQAKARLEDAVDAVKKKNHPYAVRLSQECVELSLKAVLNAVGIEYPKVHEVSDVFREIRGRFPDWFAGELDFLCESSRILFKKREPSLYGDEDALLPPNEVMSRQDATDATSRATKAYRLCSRLVRELETRLRSVS
jgi:HEPN domain-containing protein